MEAGLDPSHFWTLTYREISAILDGAAKRLRREHDERTWLAWHIAALQRAKKLPKLETMMSRKSSRKNRQSVDEQIAVARAWHAAVTKRVA